MAFNLSKMQFCIVLLCVVSLHLSNGDENAWPKKVQPKSARTKGVNSPYRTIDIDNHPQAGYYEGSADREASGNSPLGSDDEDDFEISGGGSHDVSYKVLSACQRELLLAARDGAGSFQPTCTVQGEYEVVQCSDTECWCVNSQGKEIASTRLQRSLRQLQRPDCFDLELRPLVMPTESETPPKPANRDDKRNNKERGGQGGSGYHDTASTGTGTDHYAAEHPSSFHLEILEQPLLLAGIIGGAALGLVCLVLLVMFIAYRMRKSDGGGYGVKAPSSSFAYVRAPQYT